MSLTISTKTYNEDRTTADAIAYAGPAHSVSTKDLVEMKRVYPKPTSVFAGVARPTLKIARTNALGAEVILSVSGSIPVGTTAAEIQSLIDDFRSAVGLTAFSDLVEKLDIRA